MLVYFCMGSLSIQLFQLVVEKNLNNELQPQSNHKQKSHLTGLPSKMGDQNMFQYLSMEWLRNKCLDGHCAIKLNGIILHQFA